MNATLAGQLFFFALIGALFVAASLQVSGDYDFLAQVLDVIG